MNETCLEVDVEDVVTGTGRDLLSFLGCATCPVVALPLLQVRPLRRARERVPPDSHMIRWSASFMQGIGSFQLCSCGCSKCGARKCVLGCLVENVQHTASGGGGVWWW